MTRAQNEANIRLLVQVVDQAFQRRSWHGTTLKGAIRGLTVETATFRPAGDRHNIWELVLHTAYWKYIVRRRLTRDTTLSFPRKPSNWPAVPDEATPRMLKKDVALLQNEHDFLIAAICEFPASRLMQHAPESRWSYAEHIHGVAAHDLYHAGQIQLLKKLRI